MALFAGDTVPSEASWSSLRYLLAAPVPRERLLRQKLTVAALSSLVALVLLPAWTLVVGGVAYGWGPYVGPTGDQLGWPQLLGRFAVVVAYLAVELTGSTTLTYGERELDLAPPWRRASLTDLVEEQTGIRIDVRMDPAELRRIAADVGVEKIDE